ncbi:MAG: hypothetical protein AABX52_03595 [Nanoarchaeota archaeon]
MQNKIVVHLNHMFYDPFIIEEVIKVCDVTISQEGGYCVVSCDDTPQARIMLKNIPNKVLFAIKQGSIQ